MNKKNKFIVKIVKDEESDDLMLQLSDEIMETVGWKIGDSLIWKDNEDGTWTLTKKIT